MRRKYHDACASRARMRGWEAALVSLAAAAALLWAALLAAPRVWALINPNFTPIHLTRQSQLIMYLEVGRADEEGNLPASVTKVVKGTTSEKSFTLHTDDEVLVQRLEEDVFYDEKTVGAMMFVSGGSESGGGGAKKNKGRVAMVISLNGTWFALEDTDKKGVKELTEDRSDAKAVWDGRADMLLRCVEYVMRDPDPRVPVHVGAAWAGKKRIGRLEGKVHGTIAVDLSGKGKLDLFVLSEGGDRLFRSGGKDNLQDALHDATASVKLASRSKAAAFADFNADGRLDLASSDGRTLTIWRQSERGTFEARGQSLELGRDCLGLAAVDTGRKGRAALVVSTGGLPLLVVAGEDGSLEARALAGMETDEFPGARLGEVRACLVADFDGDGAADVLQAFTEGGLFYKGKVGKARDGGMFDAPRSAGEDLYTGEGEAKARTGDFDGDGRLDVVFMGTDGLFFWANLGDGNFAGRYHQGEPDYIAKQNNSGGWVGDIDNDGRQDFVVLYKKAAPHPFFSRGFFTFGFAKEMDLMAGGFFGECAVGQQAGMLADLNADGGQDLALVLADGTVWVVFRAVDKWSALSARAVLPLTDGFAGPLTVTGWDETRCLGAWNVSTGTSGGFFGRRTPGPVTLKWRFPGGEPQEIEVILEDEPVRVVLGAEGALVRGAGRTLPPPTKRIAKKTLEAPPATAAVVKNQKPVGEEVAAEAGRETSMVPVIVLGAIVLVIITTIVAAVVRKTRAAKES